AEHAAPRVEAQVIDWFRQMLGYAPDSSGLLVSGGSMANLVGLTVARNAMAEVDVAKVGLQGAPRRMVFYGSTETHSSEPKAAALLGLGRDALRQIPVDRDFRVDVGALRSAIAAD